MRNRAVVGHDLLKRTVAVWFVLIAVEFVNGILRAIFLAPVVGDFRTRQIGVFIGSALILLVAYLLAGWLRASDSRSLLLVGFLWVVFTVAFELAFGRLVFCRSWESLGEDYNLIRGGLLPIGFVVMLFSPLIAARLRGIKRLP